MGLTKQYLRYVASDVFGLISNTKSNVVFLDLKGTSGKFCAVGACELVIVWDLHTGDRLMTLAGEKHEVTRIARSPDKMHLAAGYQDGMIRVFSLASGEVTVNYSGHKSTVTALQYDSQGLRLVSGSKDTDVIVWDIVNECGLYRLKGHKGVITQARFLGDKNLLATSSKDTYVKFWDLDTQHCFKTLVGHRSEVYDFVVVRNDKRIITGSADSELRVWDIEYYTDSDQVPLEEAEPKSKKARLGDEGEEREEEEEDDMHILKCTKAGSIMRQGRDRVVALATDPTGRVVACHGRDSMVEVFKVQTDEELKKLLAKKQKKKKRKQKESGVNSKDGEMLEVDVVVQLGLEDELRRINSVKTSSKLAGLDLAMLGKDAQTSVLLTLHNNNTVESCCVSLVEKNSEPVRRCKLTLAGHRSDVRTLTFSSDNTAIMSASGESVKIWNRASLQSIRTMACDYALTSLFAPGDRHVIVGTKSGKLQIFDISSSVLLESVEAHTGPVWSLAMAPDKRGVVSGSADHEVKFWNYELVTDESSSSSSTTSKRLTLEHVRTLKMDEDVLCVKYSPDQRLLAVALLDNTVKVFFSDTLKFFLSLYGHKLPVLCFDISSDSTLIVTCSADRNVKIWGLDFGDCHKSIFAHDDSIMFVQFVANTHLFFTCGKDRKIKQWDADNFEHIITLEGHHAEVWCLAVSSRGNYFVSASHDKSLRLWEKTLEPLVLEEERETQREKEYEESLGQSGEPVVPGESNEEVGLAGKKTVETVKAAERVMEALDVYRDETEKLKQHRLECQRSGKDLPAPPTSPYLLAHGTDTPDRYMLEVLKKVRSSELEEALLVLPFSYVTTLLQVLDVFVGASWEVELSCRCMFFLLRIHQGQIASNQVLLPVLDRLRASTKRSVGLLRDQIGFNMAGLQFLQQQMQEADEVKFFDDATDRFREKKKKKKKAILSFKV